LVQAPFQVAAVYVLGEHILVERGDGAGIKTEALTVTFEEALREHHIGDTHGRREGLGKGIEVNHRVVGIHRIDGFQRLFLERKLGGIVILHEKGSSLLGPAEVFKALGGGCGHAARVALVGCHME